MVGGADARAMIGGLVLLRRTESRAFQEREKRRRLQEKRCADWQLLAPKARFRSSQMGQPELPLFALVMLPIICARPTPLRPAQGKLRVPGRLKSDESNLRGVVTM